MTINERTDLIIKTLKMNNNSFSQSIGVNSTVIHNIVKGRNAPSYDILNKIALSFDNINMNWLVSGKGDMIKEIEVHSVKEPEEYSSDAPPCEKCVIKDALIEALNREIDTQGQFIKHLVKADCPDEGQKRKGSSSDYGNSKLSEAG